MEGCPVAAGEWRLRAVAASPWVLPNSWGRASWARQVTVWLRAASRTGRAVPQVRRGREAFEVLIANCKLQKKKRRKKRGGGKGEERRREKEGERGRRRRESIERKRARKSAKEKKRDEEEKGIIYILPAPLSPLSSIFERPALSSAHWVGWALSSLIPSPLSLPISISFASSHLDTRHCYFRSRTSTYYALLRVAALRPPVWNSRICALSFSMSSLMQWIDSDQLHSCVSTQRWIVTQASHGM